MIHVCHMTSAHASDDTRIFYKECVSLAKAGYEVSLVARGPAREEAGVRVVGVGVPSGGRLFRMLFFARRIYRQALALDAEVYHLHDPELLPYGLRLKRRGKVVIFDSHEFTAQAILEKHWLQSPCAGSCTVCIRRMRPPSAGGWMQSSASRLISWTIFPRSIPGPCR